jgi:hypothetical protein
MQRAKASDAFVRAVPGEVAAGEPPQAAARRVSPMDKGTALIAASLAAVPVLVLKTEPPSANAQDRAAILRR